MAVAMFNMKAGTDIVAVPYQAAPASGDGLLTTHQPDVQRRRPARAYVASGMTARPSASRNARRSCLMFRP